MSLKREILYLVVPDAREPYLLARVRWPDLAQAISAGQTVWQNDPGLFDLPYDEISTEVTADRAAAIASNWGAYLPTDDGPTEGAPSLIRRMPANWSNLSPAERRAWALDPATIHRRGAVGGNSPSVPAISRFRRARWRRRPVAAKEVVNLRVSAEDVVAMDAVAEEALGPDKVDLVTSNSETVIPETIHLETIEREAPDQDTVTAFDEHANF